MKKLIIAPHPDDELLGCGGYILKSRANNDAVGWIIATGLSDKDGWSKSRINSRIIEIEEVREKLDIEKKNLFQLGFPTTRLDQYPTSKLVEKVSSIFKTFKPDEILLPHPGDIHSDHKIIFEVALSSAKWFRYPSIKRILTYETISETDFGSDPRNLSFKPNTFVDITKHLEKKLEILKIYESEIGEFPFPRSIEAVKAQAKLRGSQSGFMAAEAFYLIKDLIK